MLTQLRKPQQIPSSPQQNWGWFTSHLEAIFTMITLFAMLGGWGAERFDLPLLSFGFYLIAYGTGGWFGLKASVEALQAREIEVDLLMILAALGAAYVGAPFEGAMLLFLFSLSNVLQTYALDRTRHAIEALMTLRPDTARLVIGDKVMERPLSRVQLNDIFLLRPGDRIPLDGEVIEGSSHCDQATITGESMPVQKTVGDEVLAGTINQNGSLKVRVTKLAHESTLAKLIEMVEEARNQKAETQRFLDTAEQYYAIGVIGFTLLAILLPLLFWGESFDTAFYRAMTLMVAASPCALIISTPAAILSAIGNGARRGILFKGGVYMEQAANIRAIAFDKTGTLTQGKPSVTDIVPLAENWDESKVLTIAASLEAKSEHLLAQATVQAAQAQNLPLTEASSFTAVTGKGVYGEVAGETYHIGNGRYFADHTTLPDSTLNTLEKLANEGKTAVLLTDATYQPLGALAYADQLRPQAAQVIQDLKQLGIQKVIMLTGDNQQTAEAIGAQAGVDAIYADLLPEDKVAMIQTLKAEHGPIAMVGDGVNDAPALATASIGMAMGAAGTDVALETADIVLMSDDLQNIPHVIALSHQTRRTLFINLGLAFAAIVIMIVAIFTVKLPLPLAVIGHEGGTVLVSLNGLRLLAFRR